ncbi:MAG: peptidoglycan DD-metalloendopeptidase family protein [Bacteroidales bacterium]|nr:peptidoglycan DD-metalloendopeptidase family protein [Bacteroidales bacterium]
MTCRRIILPLLLMLACFAGARAQDTEAQRSRQARLQQEIAILDRQIRDNAAQSASATTRLSLVQTKVRARQALINESDRQISALRRDISSKQKEIDALQARLDTMTIYYEKLVRNAYKNRDARKWYMYILASENLSQGFRRYGYLKNLSREMNVQASRIKEAKASLEQERASLESMNKEARALRDSRVKEMDKLKSEEKDIKSLSSRLAREKTKYQKELADKKKEAADLERAIRNAIGKSTSSKKPVDYVLAGEFVANKGKLPWPADGPVTGRFGKQFHPVFKNLQLPANNGINIAMSPGADVKAVFDGVVAQISVLPGYHQCILVQHGNHYTLYSKIKTASVKPGQKVTTGQKVGTVDTIGGETVLHFEIWNEKTTPQNPETWLRPR